MTPRYGFECCLPQYETERILETHRWSKLVDISHNPDVDPARAGVSTGGMVLIRPDGHIGFRFPAGTLEAFTTLDRHLSSYLIPDPVDV